MDSYVIARRVFEFGGDCRLETLMTLTQLPNTCFQAHEVHLLFRGWRSLDWKGYSSLPQPTPTARGQPGVRFGLGEKVGRPLRLADQPRGKVNYEESPLSRLENPESFLVMKKMQDSISDAS